MLLVDKMHLLERLGISFMLGFGIFTLLMFCYSSLGIRITTESTLLALGIGVGFLLVLFKLFKRRFSINLVGLVKSFKTFSLLEKIIVFIISALIVGSLAITLYFPVNAWDAIVLYDFRAKIIVQQGFYTQIAGNFSYFTGYPLFTSLSHTLVYLFGGNNPQFLYSFMYTSMIFIFYSNLREFVDRNLSLVASLILATTPVIFDHSTFAYTNLPYTVFLATGTMYLFTWIVKKKNIGYLILSAVLTGLSAWTRVSEPFWAINILILVSLSVYKFKKYWFSAIVYVIFLFLIKEPWSMFNYSQPVSQGVTVTTTLTTEVESYVTRLLGTVLNPVRIGEVAIFIYKNVIVSWYPLLFLFLFSALINFKRFFKKPSTLFLLIILLYFFLLSCATYIFSFSFSGWKEIPGSAERMAIFFIPLMVYYIGLCSGELKYKHK